MYHSWHLNCLPLDDEVGILVFFLLLILNCSHIPPYYEIKLWIYIEFILAPVISCIDKILNTYLFAMYNQWHLRYWAIQSQHSISFYFLNRICGMSEKWRHDRCCFTFFRLSSVDTVIWPYDSNISCQDLKWFTTSIINWFIFWRVQD